MKAPASPASGVRGVLGDEIASALQALGVVPIAATVITGLPSTTSQRDTFRIALEDGTVVKVRRRATAVRARRFVRLIGSLSHDRLPTVRLLTPNVSIEEWIDGTPLNDLPLTSERVLQAADLLASLNATTSIEGRGLRTSELTRPVLLRAERELMRLATAGAITGAERLQLVETLRRYRPERAIVGLTHNDFCAENLVEDRRGRIFAIDNAGMRVGFLEFDLARTWYRWPMAESAWRLFVGRYAVRCASPAPEHEPFWRVAAVAKSANQRVVKRGMTSDASLQRLRTMLADLPHPIRGS